MKNGKHRPSPPDATIPLEELALLALLLEQKRPAPAPKPTEE